MHSIFVWYMLQQSDSIWTRYDTTYAYEKYSPITNVYVFLWIMKKKTYFNYRKFDLEDELVGVPHTWYLSDQSFNNPVWRELYMVAMNNWKI